MDSEQRMLAGKKNKNSDFSGIHLLDTTRIPEDWYKLTERLSMQAMGSANLISCRDRKEYKGLSEETICLI